MFEQMNHFVPILAYIDAGTGSIIIQVAIGFFVGGAAAVKIFWKNITGKARKKSKDNLQKDRKDKI